MGSYDLGECTPDMPSALDMDADGGDTVQSASLAQREWRRLDLRAAESIATARARL